MLKTALLFIAVLTATTMAVSAAPPDPLMWIWQNAWPKPQPKAPAASPPPAARVVKPSAAAKRETTPIPKPRPPKAIVAPEKKRAAVARRAPGLPSCAVVRREYDRMTTAQRWAAYMRATSEQVAHGRRCLGM